MRVGCPSKQPQAPRAVDDAALRIRIATAEARRAAGIDELIEVAHSTDMHARELAVRGLGRSGGGKARAALEQALDDKASRVVAAACLAIGVAASLDEDPAWEPGEKLVAALQRGPEVQLA